MKRTYYNVTIRVRVKHEGDIPKRKLNRLAMDMANSSAIGGCNEYGWYNAERIGKPKVAKEL